MSESGNVVPLRPATRPLGPMVETGEDLRALLQGWGDVKMKLRQAERLLYQEHLDHLCIRKSDVVRIFGDDGSARARVNRKIQPPCASAESNRPSRGLLASALRAVAVGRDRPEYGPITTDRALRRPEAFEAKTGALLPATGYRKGTVASLPVAS